MSSDTDNASHLLELYKIEYDKLKAEQAQRIQFRDNLLMAHLTVVGAIVGFIVTNITNPFIAYAYLIIPWTSGILGWAYFNNDLIISNIRDYLRNELAVKLKASLKLDASFQPFGWERHTSGHRLRKWRKAMQAAMDFATFTVPALAALGRLCYTPWPQAHPFFPLLFVIDALITAGLLVGFVVWNRKEQNIVRPEEAPEISPPTPPIPPQAAASPRTPEGTDV